jgi:hypothetical protein
VTRTVRPRARVLADALQATRDEDHEHRPLANLEIAPNLERANEHHPHRACPGGRPIAPAVVVRRDDRVARVSGDPIARDP